MHQTDSAPKKQIITIAGRPGSGKSTTAKQTAARLGFRHFSSGDLFRLLGKERGVDVLSANMTPGVTEELDHLVDSKLRAIGVNDDRLVIDSRTAWHWIPNSFKVFLDLDLMIAAQRILDGMTEERLASENVHSSPEKYADLLKNRLDVEAQRYKTIYGINPYDPTNYDLVIDTAQNDIEEAVNKVVSGYKEWHA